MLTQKLTHVTKMCMNLISMGQLDDEGYSTTFGKGGWEVSKGLLVMANVAANSPLWSLFKGSQTRISEVVKFNSN